MYSMYKFGGRQFQCEWGIHLQSHGNLNAAVFVSRHPPCSGRKRNSTHHTPKLSHKNNIEHNLFHIRLLLFVSSMLSYYLRVCVVIIVLLITVLILNYPVFLLASCIGDFRVLIWIDTYLRHSKTKNKRVRSEKCLILKMIPGLHVNMEVVVIGQIKNIGKISNTLLLKRLVLDLNYLLFIL